VFIYQVGLNCRSNSTVKHQGGASLDRAKNVYDRTHGVSTPKHIKQNRTAVKGWMLHAAPFNVHQISELICPINLYGYVLVHVLNFCKIYDIVPDFQQKNLTIVDFVSDKARHTLTLLYPQISKNSHLVVLIKILIIKLVIRPIFTYGCPTFGNLAKLS
jgi:hypothetical protein